MLLFQFSLQHLLPRCVIFHRCLEIAINPLVTSSANTTHLFVVFVVVGLKCFANRVQRSLKNCRLIETGLLPDAERRR